MCVKSRVRTDLSRSKTSFGNACCREIEYPQVHLIIFYILTSTNLWRCFRSIYACINHKIWVHSMHWTNIYAGICVYIDLIEIYVDHSNYKNLKTDRTIVSSHFSVLQYATILKSLTNEIFCVLNKMKEPVHLFELCSTLNYPH